MMMKIIIFILAGITASRAEYDAHTEYEFADTDQDGIISDYEFQHWTSARAFFQRTETIYHFTGPITVAKFKQVLGHSLDTPMNPLSADEAVQLTNYNEDDIIDAQEFETYYRNLVYTNIALMEPTMEKTALIFRCTGEIPVSVFKTALEEYEASNPSTMSGYTVEDAVNNANSESFGVNFINAREFNAWFDLVNDWSNQQLKIQMAGDDGIITKDEFIANVDKN